VVIGTVAFGLAMLIPALARTRTNSPAFQCLENLCQLQRAEAMYAADHSGSLAPNFGQFTYTYAAWCTGVLDWNQGVGVGSLGEGVPPDANTNYLVKALLGPYVGRIPAYYKCPADKVPGLIGPRVRSYAMNAFVGVADNTLTTTFTYGRSYGLFRNQSDLTSPGPANTWVLMDEHPDSIDDCYFVQAMPSTSSWPTYTAWGELPASYHNNAGALSFADGHVEAHKWLDPQTVWPVQRIHPASGLGTTSVHDSAWLVARTTAPD